MPLQLSKASFEDLPALMSVVFAAYADPYHPFLGLMYPGFGSESKEVIEQCMHNATESHRKRWKASSTEEWVKVVDTESGEIVGVSRWQIYEQNPFPDGPPHVEAEWYPEGSRIREYCNYLMNDRLERQASRCAMPHVWLNMICTHPKYRRRGVAALMVQWGIDRADEMDCETFIEAGVEGRLLYRNFGLVDVEKLSTPRPEKEMDEEWEKLEEMYPFEATWMWRPKQGMTAKEMS